MYKSITIKFPELVAKEIFKDTIYDKIETCAFCASICYKIKEYEIKLSVSKQEAEFYQNRYDRMYAKLCIIEQENERLEEMLKTNRKGWFNLFNRNR